MKFHIAAVSALAIGLSSVMLATPATAEGDGECTHGKLYVSEAETNTVHVFDLSGSLDNLTPETSITDVPGGPELYLQTTASMVAVAAVYRGVEDNGYADGGVSFIHTGLVIEDHGDHAHVDFIAPSILNASGISCNRPIHFVPHDGKDRIGQKGTSHLRPFAVMADVCAPASAVQLESMPAHLDSTSVSISFSSQTVHIHASSLLAGKIAIFCDGNFENPAVNSTIWVLDESMIEAGEPSVIFNTTLDGSHHGAAVPVDDGHLLHSVATPDRAAGLPEAVDYSLPDTFQVISYPDGAVLHELSDTSSPDTHCSGFHGEWAHDDQIALACDEVHGGILRVDYDSDGDASAGAYTSRALQYPESFPNHRTGSFIGHDKADFIVGNFANSDDGTNHLMAFQPDDTVITDGQVFSLPARQCGFAFEMGGAEDVVVFMPNGTLLVLEFRGDHGDGEEGAHWHQVAAVEVVPGMQACTEAVFVVGVEQAFVMTVADPTLYVVDLHELLEHPEDGGAVTSTPLSFVPLSGVVAGAPSNVACATAHSHDDEDEPTEPSSAATTVAGGIVASPVLALAALLMAILSIR